MRGFTLIELLVVISIIGILIAGILFIIDPLSQLQKANDARRKADLPRIQRALEQYYQDNDAYPATARTTDTYNIVNSDDAIIAWGTSWDPYIESLPSDPDTAKRYEYIQSDNGQSYSLYARLDRDTDPQVCTGTAGACTEAPTNACGALACNYRVTSPNISQ